MFHIFLRPKKLFLQQFEYLDQGWSCWVEILRLNGFWHKFLKKQRYMPIELQILRLNQFQALAAISQLKLLPRWNKKKEKTCCNFHGLRHPKTQKVPDILNFKVVFLRLNLSFENAIFIQKDTYFFF